MDNFLEDLEELEELVGEGSAGIGRYGFEVIDDMDDVLDAEEEEAIVMRVRRPYRFMTRIGLDQWDDVDFLQRFRIMKPTVLRVLTIIEERLVFLGDGR